MIYQSWQIRDALNEIAMQSGRNHFEVCVVKRVINSFREDCEDILKDKVQKVLNAKYPFANKDYKELNTERVYIQYSTEMASKEQIADFRKVCNSYFGAKKRLSSLSGMDANKISRVVWSGRLTKADYDLVSPFFDEVKKFKGG